MGSGPAGLMLGQILHLNGIDSVIIETRSQDHVIDRVRAGVLEQTTVDLMRGSGVGDRLEREGLRHSGIHLAFHGQRHHIDFAALIGRSITVYGQNEVMRDYIHARCVSGRPMHFEVSDVSVEDITCEPVVRFCKDGEQQEIHCNFVAGCDGFHGICRRAFPAGALRVYERVYPFGWLGILAAAAPSSEELVYSLHDRGFALFSMRSPTVTRLYLQCRPDEDAADWSDDRIWAEIQTRLSTSDGWKPREGRIVRKAVTPMRSFVVEPMRHGRLFLAGDAAHILPPTGAKGLNLAAADVRVLAHALAHYYRSRSERLLDAYSATCLARIWKAQRFSWWMTSMLHRFSDQDDFDYRRQLAELEYIVSSRAGMTSLAENYAGLPLDIPIVLS